MVYTLIPDGNTTRVEFEHARVAADDEVFANLVKGWAHFLGSLKSYLETGKGTPHVRASQQAA